MAQSQKSPSKLPQLSLKDLLEAGCHFGHQVKRWHPRMRQYLYGARGGVHIFDLVKTKEALQEAEKVVAQIAADSGNIIFVGTKRQAQGIAKEAALRCGMPYVAQRWMGGLLTNFSQLKKSIDKLEELKTQKKQGEFDHLTKKERLLIDRQIAKLEKFFGGLTSVTQLPQALFIIDTHHEATAVREARRTGVKIIGLVDSNANPDLIDQVIPANDDAVKSIQLIVTRITDAVIRGKEKAAKVSKKEDSEK